MKRINGYRYVYLSLIPILAIGCATKPRLSEQYNHQCTMESNAAMTAIRLRDKGKTYDDLASQLGPLTEKSSRLHRMMFEIVDEVFNYQGLNDVTYPTYRFELCARQLTKLPFEEDYAKVHSLLLGCQDKHGPGASTAGTQCIRAVFPEPAKNDKLKEK